MPDVGNRCVLTPDELQPAEPDAPFQPGDEVFVHGGSCEQGRVGRVERVLAASRICLVRFEPPVDDRELLFEQLTLRSPPRRDLLDDYRRAIARAVPLRGYNLRKRLWWGLAATREHPIAALSDLLAAGAAVEAEIDAECAAAVAAEQALLVQRFVGSAAEQAGRWSAEWERWCGWREEIERVFAREIAPALLAAAPCPDDRQPDEWARGLISKGDALRERCELRAERARRPGNAYDAIPFRPVDLAPRSPVTPRPVGPMARTNEDIVSMRAEHAALRALGFELERHRAISNLELALIASGDPDAIRAVAEDHLDMPDHERRIEGLLLFDRPGATPWTENPWGIPSRAGRDAIRSIWSPLSGRADRWVDALERWTLGLVLVRDEASVAMELGYLHLVPSPAWELVQRGLVGEPPSERPESRALSDWRDRGSVGLLLCGPPRDPDDDTVPCLPGLRLPLALRELYAVHAGLSHHGVGIASPDRLCRLLDWDLGEALLTRLDESNPGRMREEFVEFCADGFGNQQVLDLDRLDDRQDPLVADWDHETWQIGRPEPFWPWFEEAAPSRLLGVDAPSASARAPDAP